MSISFDGSNDAWSLADIAVADAFTVLQKIKWLSLTTDDAGGVSADNYPTAPRYAVNGPYYTAAGTPGWTSECYVNGTGSTSNATGTGTVSTNTWYSTAIDRLGATARSFVNNVQIGASITVGTGAFTFYNTRIGAHYFNGTNNQFGHVVVAEYAIYRCRLVHEERKRYQLGESPLTIRPEFLVRYVPAVNDRIDIKRRELAGRIDAPVFTGHPFVKPLRRRIVGLEIAAAVATTTPKLIGGNLIRPNLVRGRLAA